MPEPAAHHSEPRRLDPNAVTLVAVGALSTVVVVATLIAVFGFGLGVPHDRTPTLTPPLAPAPAATPAPLSDPASPLPSPSAEAKREETPTDQPRAWLDEALRPQLEPWWNALEEARAMALADDLSMVHDALAILDRVLAEARKAEPPLPEAVVALESQIQSLRARADAVRLRELLDQSPSPSP